MARSTVTPNQYSRVIPITTSDTVAIASGVPDGIIITAAGNIVIVDVAGNSNTITGALVGSIYPINVVRVNATGTTATASALYYI